MTGGDLDDGLLERADELAALEAAIRDASEGQGGVVVVEGAAGIGKSTLLREAAALARDRDFEVLRARGSELEREFAFGAALQLLERRVARAADDDRERLLAGSASLARGLFEPLQETPEGGGRDGGQAGAARDLPLIHGLFWLLSNLAEDGQVALLVDDLHWVDGASARVLAYLAQRIADLPIVCVVASRPAEPGANLDPIGELGTDGGARLIRPAALGERSVVALVQEWAGEARPHPDLAPACGEATGGNPLLLRELLGALADEGADPAAEATVRRAREIGPEGVSRLVEAALRRLGPEAGAVAHALAVLGDGAEPAHVAELARAEPAVAREAAAALATAAILQEEAAEGGLAFHHPIVRAALYEEIDPMARASAHGRAARLLMRDGAAPERVAAQLVASAPGGDAEAVAALRAAAAQASGHGSPASAVTYLRRALGEPPPPGARRAVLVELGAAEVAVGDPAAAGHLEDALDGLDEPRERAEVLRLLARAHFHAGRAQAAAGALDAALEGLGSGAADRDLAAELTAEYAMAALWDPELRPGAFRRVESLLDGDAEPTTAAERLLLANLAGDAFLRGEDRERVTELCVRAWGGGALLEAFGSEEPALYTLVAAFLWADEPALAGEVAEAALADARARGSIFAFATASYGRAGVHRVLGRLPEAMADAEASVATRDQGWEMFLPGSLALVSHVHLEQGRTGEALAVLDVGAEREAAWAASPVYAFLREHRGWALVARGDAAGALAEFEAAGELLVGPFMASNPALCPWRSGAALALKRLDRLDEARERADEEVALARAFGAPRALGGALRARGAIEPPREGLPHLEEAVAVLEPSPSALERGHALVELGAALLRLNRRAEAREPLRRGLEIAEHSAAGALATRARDELGGAGANPGRTTLSGPESLTASEARVARMAVTGLTNREIAQSLFVTVKSVQYHLGNSYRKLEIGGRGELAAALAGGGELYSTDRAGASPQSVSSR